jgi:hypothetical protein
LEKWHTRTHSNFLWLGSWLSEKFNLWPIS